MKILKVILSSILFLSVVPAPAMELSAGMEEIKRKRKRKVKRKPKKVVKRKKVSFQKLLVQSNHQF